MTESSDKLDFSRLNNEDNSLISWEDLFPEYAIGGQTSQSGETEFSAGFNTQNQKSSSSQQTSTQADITTHSSGPANAVVYEGSQSPLPASSEVTIGKHSAFFTENNTHTERNTHKETSSAEKRKMDVLTLTDLPDTPSLLDDVVTVIPEEQAKSTAPSQAHGFNEQPSVPPSQAHGFNEQSSTSPAQAHSFTEQSSTPPAQAHGFAEQSSTSPAQAHSFTEQSSKPPAQAHGFAEQLSTPHAQANASETNAQMPKSTEQTQLSDMGWLDNALKNVNQEIITGDQLTKNQDYWANRFNQLNFPGMDLMAVSYIGSFTYDMLEQHLLLKRVVRDFVRLLSYNYTMELRSAGVSEEGIFYMKKGKIPENYTVHLKYPPEYGGTIDFNNMVFMQDKPFHDMIHAYMDEQILTATGISYPPLLYVPAPVGKIYVPFGMFTGSGGKNKQDRSVYAGFSKAAFEKIALK